MTSGGCKLGEAERVAKWLFNKGFKTYQDLQLFFVFLNYVCVVKCYVCCGVDLPGKVLTRKNLVPTQEGKTCTFLPNCAGKIPWISITLLYIAIVSLYSGTVAFLHRSSCPWARGRCPARQPESGGSVGGRLQPREGEGRPAATSSKGLDRQSALALNGRPGLTSEGQPGPCRSAQYGGCSDLGRVGVDVGMAAPRWGGRPAATSKKLYALTACRRWL